MIYISLGNSLYADNDSILSDFGLNDFIRLVETFGFYLVNLDIREESTNHTNTVVEIMKNKHDVDYDALDEKSRIKKLEEFIKSDITLDDVYTSLSDESKKVLDVFSVVTKLRHEISEQAFGTYVSHVFEVLALAKLGGMVTNDSSELKSSIQVAPLFETIDDLTRIEEILEDLFSNETYNCLIGHYKIKNYRK